MTAVGLENSLAGHYTKDYFFFFIPWYGIVQFKLSNESSRRAKWDLIFCLMRSAENC